MNKKSEYRGKKNRPDSRGKSRDRKPEKEDWQPQTKEAEEDRKRMGFNDPEWYSKNPELTVAAASIPFPYRPGTSIPIASTYNVSSKQITVRYGSIPGIVTLNWIPSLGYSDNPNSPISIASRQIYAKVRANFSGSLEADPPDFAIYLGALDSIFAYIACLKRLYRLVNSYSPNNHFIPEGVVQALGVSTELYQDLVTHKMDFFGMINQLIGMSERFVCPAVFTMFNRHYWLNDNVYMDFPSMNAQFYAFVQEGFYSFKLQTVPGGTAKAGGLECLSFPVQADGALDYATTLFNFGVSLINALSESDDAYTISGYLMRTYDGSEKFTVDRLGIDERFDALYVPEVLSQIENACAIDVPFDNIINDVSQDPVTNTVYCTPTAQLAVPDITRYQAMPLLNIRNDSPSAMDVIEASRMASYLDYIDVAYTSGDTEINVPILAGTEIVTSMVVTYGSAGTWTSTAVANRLVATQTVAQAVSALMLSNFDWNPRVIVNWTASNVPLLLWDVHNVTSLSMEQMRQINKVCLYSEFDSFSAK